MKRIIALVFLIMMIALSASALALITGDYPKAGLSVDFPDSFSSTKGTIAPNEYGQIDDGLFYMEFLYYGISEDELNVLAESSDQDAVYLALDKVRCIITSVVAVDSSIDVSDMSDMNDVVELTKVGDYTFFMFTPPATEEEKALKPEFTAELASLREQFADVIRNARFSEPLINGREKIGRKLSFTTKDIDGNDVSSDKLFGAHEVTVVNVWTSWCGPCIGELSELAETNRRLAKYDCAIVGVLADGDSTEGIADGKAWMDEYGVDYPVLLPGEAMETLLEVRAYPTTYFIGRDGTVLRAPVEGAPVDMSEPNEYEKIVYKLIGVEIK